jgi:DNA (cytosine-5)-methyltransferase 1
MRADALDVLEDMAAAKVKRFDVIHASPPCQSYSVTASLHDAEYPELVPEVRRLLNLIGLPYVIENVIGAPLVNAFRLCGSSFGLGVRRHRLFETSPMMLGAPQCAHHLQPEPVDVTGTGGPSSKPRTGGGIHRKPKNLAHAREAMGIDWMTRPELSEAVPPAYTEWIGRRLIMENAA